MHMCVFLRVLGSGGWGRGIGRSCVGSAKNVGFCSFRKSYVYGFEKIGSMKTFLNVGGCN